VEEILAALSTAAKSGKIGDGKIFVLPVDDALRIRNGDRGESAL
jgi:nitrogen regulatory protein P-II 1